MNGRVVVRVGLLERSGAGHVRICCKGAPGRDRQGEEARNINDSSRALRLDRGLCNRFGQPALPWAGRGGVPRSGRRPRRVPLTPKRALRTRKCSSNRRSRVRNAPFDEEGVGRARRGPRRRSRPGTSPMIRGERLTLARILVRKAQYVRPSTASYTCAMSTGNHQQADRRGRGQPVPEVVRSAGHRPSHRCSTEAGSAQLRPILRPGRVPAARRSRTA